MTDTARKTSSDHRKGYKIIILVSLLNYSLSLSPLSPLSLPSLFSLPPSLPFNPLAPLISHGINLNYPLSPFSTAVMPAIPEHIHSRLLEARDLWAKAEASLPTDTTVAYMLFTQHNGIFTIMYKLFYKVPPPPPPMYMYMYTSDIIGIQCSYCGPPSKRTFIE